MGILYKRILDTWTELQNFLTARGFTIANNKITYDETPISSLNYWSYDSDGTVNFVNSEGNNAFYYNLTDFVNGKKCGCIFLELIDDGFVLFLSPVDDNFSVSDLTFCCTNNYHRVVPAEGDPYYERDNNPLDNGLVIATPTDEDGKWHFLWRDEDPTDFYFDVDNTAGSITKGGEIPHTKMIQAPLTVTLTKAYLNYGVWSKYIYTQVLGEINPPGNVFKINGQKFISFSDNTQWRCPVFKLEPTEVVENDSSSTEEYSPKKTYKVGDYCIFEGLLWKCIVAVTTPQPFDQNSWITTTVPHELAIS